MQWRLAPNAIQHAKPLEFDLAVAAQRMRRLSPDELRQWAANTTTQIER